MFQIVTMDQERLWLRLPLAMVPQETLPSKKTAEGILWDLWECPVVATAALLKRGSHLTFLSGELVIFSLLTPSCQMRRSRRLPPGSSPSRICGS